MINMFLRKTYFIDKICSPFADEVWRLGRHFDIYIQRQSVRGLHLFTMVAKYLPLIFAGRCEVQTLLTLRIFFPLTANTT